VTDVSPVTILDRPLYSVTEAARLLRIPSASLRRWLEGWDVKGTHYEPVIRPVATGLDAVTWAEFIEAGFLREYRLAKRVSLQRMRPFLERARTELKVPYPLAHFKPFVSNRELVYELQEESSLDPALFLVRREGDQMIWAEPVQEFLERVDFEPESDLVARLHPLGRDRPVVIDPAVTFGIPQIRGLRAELIAESVAAGGYSEAEESWGVSAVEIDAALEWQQALTVRQAA
jgi:hypothetical protein